VDGLKISRKTVVEDIMKQLNKKFGKGNPLTTNKKSPRISRHDD